jgi:hypothetical protein
MRTPTCFNDRVAEKADDPGSAGRDHHLRRLDREMLPRCSPRSAKSCDRCRSGVTVVSCVAATLRLPAVRSSGGEGSALQSLHARARRIFQLSSDTSPPSEE